jgi:hypothetical protein
MPMLRTVRASRPKSVVGSSRPSAKHAGAAAQVGAGAEGLAPAPVSTMARSVGVGVQRLAPRMMPSITSGLIALRRSSRADRDPQRSAAALGAGRREGRFRQQTWCEAQ